MLQMIPTNRYGGVWSEVHGESESMVSSSTVWDSQTDWLKDVFGYNRYNVASAMYLNFMNSPTAVM